MSAGGRGFFGIGVYHPKREVNVGTLWRHAWLYGADFIFTIGPRYRHQAGDTVKAPLSIPMYNYESFESFESNLPERCPVVCVELTDTARPLNEMYHPDRCAYLLGAEDHGLPERILAGRHTVVIPSPRDATMNVANAGTVVMYDRYAKQLAMARPRLEAV